MKPSSSQSSPSTFASLRVRNYRLYVTSLVITSTCGWMQRVAQDWMMLRLTGDVALVGLTLTLQLGPLLVFALWGGVLADRFDRRRLLMVTQCLTGACALTLGLLALFGAVRPWHILAGAATLGLIAAVDTPARQAFVPDVAGQDQLRNAISINSTVFQLGALTGPALAGGCVALVGEGWSFIVNAAACVTAVLLLVAMRAAELSQSPAAERGPGQLRQGLKYAGREPRILWAVVLVGFVALTGINLATVLVAYANDVFQLGAGGYGLLNSCVAGGAVLGALASARRTSLRLRWLVCGAATLGALQVLAGSVDSHVPFAITLVAVGAASLLYLTSGNTMVQTAVAAAMRGRVMALYVLVLFGGQAASGVIIGRVADAHGASAAMTACGLGPLTGALVVGAILAWRQAARRPRYRPDRRAAEHRPIQAAQTVPAARAKTHPGRTTTALLHHRRHLVSRQRLSRIRAPHRQLTRPKAPSAGSRTK